MTEPLSSATPAPAPANGLAFAELVMGLDAADAPLTSLSHAAQVAAARLEAA